MFAKSYCIQSELLLKSEKGRKTQSKEGEPKEVRIDSGSSLSFTKPIKRIE